MRISSKVSQAVVIVANGNAKNASNSYQNLIIIALTFESLIKQDGAKLGNIVINTASPGGIIFNLNWYTRAKVCFNFSRKSNRF